ncbi:MAG TPA: ABC transporter substrate-binding protein [Acidimicrobiales bacterium]|nr:ABC transporter substrate-binding protein [Acidimicrobiales bacterium]
MVLAISATALLFIAPGVSGAASKRSALASMVPAAIRKSGVLTIGSDLTVAPYDFISKGKVAGIDDTLCGEAAKTLGLKVRFINLSFAGLITALEANKFDVICSGMYDTPVRAAVVDFVPYIQTGISIVTATGNPDNIKSLTDLCGHTVAVTLGSAEQTLATSQVALCPAGKTLTVSTFPEYADAIAAMEGGRAQALLGDDPTMAYDVKSVPSLEVVDSGINTVVNGIAVNRNDPQLAGALSAALYTMERNGTYAAGLKKWGVAADAITTF